MRALAISLLLLLAFLLLSSCYVSEQGFHYLGLLTHARSAATVLADRKTSEATRKLVEAALRIRNFGVQRLGLAETRNYRTLVELDTDSLARVVQACASLSFDRYLWTYPLVGKLPYRGYFKAEEAKHEAEGLRGEGWDVIVRPVDAFSTLGFLPDPLWSFMASYSEGDLAETILHELCHATAFRKGDDTWNEELATFVGRQGSLEYLADRFGSTSPELAEAERSRRESEALTLWLKGTAEELEALYVSELPDEIKRQKKAEIIAARATAYQTRYASLFETDRYRDFPMERLNNAYLDLYRLYEGESDLYRDYYLVISKGKLRDFIADMAVLAKGKDDPKTVMRERLGARKEEGNSGAQ